MALTKCPECQQDVSDKATSCPHCGYPLDNVSSTIEAINTSIAPATDTVESASSSEEDIPHSFKKVYMAIAIFAIAGLLLLFVFSRSPKVTASNLDTNAFYSSSLGLGVRLGQSKSYVDKLLGAPVAQENTYLYEGYLYVTYDGGKVKTLVIEYPNERWETFKGISLNTTTDELIQLLGEPVQTLEDGKTWCYQRKDHVICFYITHQTILYIGIIDTNGQRLLTQDEMDALDNT